MSPLFFIFFFSNVFGSFLNLASKTVALIRSPERRTPAGRKKKKRVLGILLGAHGHAANGIEKRIKRFNTNQSRGFFFLTKLLPPNKTNRCFYDRKTALCIYYFSAHMLGSARNINIYNTVEQLPHHFIGPIKSCGRTRRIVLNCIKYLLFIFFVLFVFFFPHPPHPSCRMPLSYSS